MENVEKTISNLIESQFPAFYAEEGPRFISFVKSYYEWMEDANNTIYHSRRLLDYKDIDNTVDDFLIHFKNKYLNSIQFDTAVETDRLVKHSLDLYRSKGTERGIDLFFRSIFGTAANIYYPGSDVFKLSDAKWVVPRYLELYDSPNIKSFIGLQIEGINSGATAFVESYIKKRSANSGFFTHLYYINNIVGEFQKDEKIKASTSGLVGPIIRGSVSSIDVIDGSSGYSNGDIVNITSLKNGIDAQAKVNSVEAVTGKISFTLDNGGWGYNSNSEILIAEKMLTLTNVKYDGNNFSQFETLAQPLANVEYSNLSGGNLQIGDVLIKVDPSTNLVYSEGTVLSVNAVNSSYGYVRIAINSGKSDTEHDLHTEDDEQLQYEDGINIVTDGNELTEDGYIYKFLRLTDESGSIIEIEDGDYIIVDDYEIIANVVSFTDETAYGNLIKYSGNATIEVTSTSTKFANGEFVYQVDDSNSVIGTAVIQAASYTGTNGTIRVINYEGYFLSNNTLYSSNSSASSNVINITTDVGLVDIVNEFFSGNGATIISLSSNVTSEISRIGQGNGASFSISNTFLYTETVPINTDLISDYIDVDLASNDYGFPAAGAEDIDTIIGDALSYTNVTVGKISSIIVTNYGTDYDTVPFIVLYDPVMSHFNKRDWTINIANNVGLFTVGEVVKQDDENRGIVKEGSNSSVLFLERISFQDIETNTVITGEISGSTAIPIYVSEDSGTDKIGLNAIVTANNAAVQGSVTSLDIIDSGFAYDDNELVSFSKDGLTSGTALVNLGGNGVSVGFYIDNNSMLSSTKKLHDGHYYQEFSYEIQTGIQLNKYVDVLKSILHMAGTKHFSRFVLDTVITTNTNISTTVSVE